jgi:hypothetical protein
LVVIMVYPLRWDGAGPPRRRVSDVLTWSNPFPKHRGAEESRDRNDVVGRDGLVSPERHLAAAIALFEEAAKIAAISVQGWLVVAA